MEKQISDLVRMGETIQARIKRFGPQTALSITRAVLALNENEVNQVQAELEQKSTHHGFLAAEGLTSGNTLRRLLPMVRVSGRNASMPWPVNSVTS